MGVAVGLLIFAVGKKRGVGFALVFLRTPLKSRRNLKTAACAFVLTSEKPRFKRSRQVYLLVLSGLLGKLAAVGWRSSNAFGETRATFRKTAGGKGALARESRKRNRVAFPRKRKRTERRKESLSGDKKTLAEEKSTASVFI